LPPLAHFLTPSMAKIDMTVVPFFFPLFQTILPFLMFAVLPSPEFNPNQPFSPTFFSLCSYSITSFFFPLPPLIVQSARQSFFFPQENYLVPLLSQALFLSRTLLRIFCFLPLRTGPFTFSQELSHFFLCFFDFLRHTGSPSPLNVYLFGCFLFSPFCNAVFEPATAGQYVLMEEFSIVDSIFPFLLLKIFPSPSSNLHIPSHPHSWRRS